MTKEQREAMGLLREAGYAITIIDPKTLGDTSPIDAQSAMKEAAHKAIDEHYADRPEDRPRRWGFQGWELPPESWAGKPRKTRPAFACEDEIALLFDFDPKDPDRSELLKHGAPADVQKCYLAIEKTAPAFESILKESNRTLVFIKGRFSVIELNKMINIPGYVGTWYSTLIQVDNRPSALSNSPSIHLGGSL